MYGIGLRHQHFPRILELLEENPSAIQVDWFEGITENFFDTEGRPLKVLERVRRDKPISLHGVSLSIGSAEELDFDYLKKIKSIYDRIDPFLISDHLCWTGHKNRNLHNLLPVPYNNETLEYLVSRIERVQDYLGRSIAFENLSAYFDFENSTYKEWDFLKELSRRSGCTLLLDINNIYVNSVNHNFDPYEYLDAIPNELISEVHLAGFTDMGTHLFDTHSCPVWDGVWELFKKKILSGLKVPVLVEWDEDIPSYERVEEEAMKARAHAT